MRMTDDAVDQARVALSNFRNLQPTLNAYARMLTGRADVRVVAAAHDNGSTDGKVIRYRPPISLGKKIPHQRWACDKRDPETKLMRCPSCAQREDVLCTIYHEIAHIWFNSFAGVTRAAKETAIREAIAATGTVYGEKIQERLTGVSRWMGYMELAGVVSPFMPMLLNCLEDARVNAQLFDAMPGTKVMFDANTAEIFRNGVEQVGEQGTWTRSLWRDRPLNSQAMIGVFCMASGYDFTDWLDPFVVHALSDQQLVDLVNKINDISSIESVFSLAFPILARLRELGFFRDESDPEDDYEEPEEADDSDDEQSDSDDDDFDDEQSDDPDDEQEAGNGEEQDDSEAGSDSEEDDSSGDDTEGSDDSGDGTDAGSSDRDDEPATEGEEVDDEGEANSESDDRSDSAGSSSGGSEASDDESDDAPDGAGDGAGDSEAGPEESDGSEDSLPEEGDAGDDSPADAGDADPADLRDDEESRGGMDGPDGPDSGDEVESESGDTADTDDGPTGSGLADDEGADDDGVAAEFGQDDSDGGEPGDSSTSEPSREADGPVDTGAQEHGVRIEGELPLPKKPDLDWGTVDDIEIEVHDLGGHEPPSSMHVHGPDEAPHEHRSEEDAEGDEVVKTLIIQGVYFEKPSVNVLGVNIKTEEDGVFDHDGKAAYLREAFGVDAEVTPSEAILGPALLRARVVFADNYRAKQLIGQRRGRVHGPSLGRRAPVNDDRLFQQRRLPGREDYFVGIGLDNSGSTVGTNIVLIKALAYAEAELLHRLGIPFFMYAHAGQYAADRSRNRRAMDLEITVIKEGNEPWTDKHRSRLQALAPTGANLDGHTLEFYRKRLEEHRATTKVLHYYTDGAMPAENFDEELEILQREIKILARQGVILEGVGVRTDSPKQHGLPTVLVNEQADVLRVVDSLEKRLTKR